MKFNVVVVGVGGQGALTTAGIIARAAMRAGHNVVAAETHGMAQRGGSVEVHVRIGNVFSPLVPEGDADLMIALEPVEALRYAKYLSEKSTVLLNTRKVIPPSVISGDARYPELDEIISDLSAICRVIPVEAWKLAENLGNVLAANVVVIGMALKCCRVPFNYGDVEWAIRDVMAGKALELNLKALEIGYKSEVKVS